MSPDAEIDRSPERTLLTTERTAGEVGPPPPDDRIELRWARCGGTDVVVKAGAGPLRERLRREAEVVRRCASERCVTLVELVEGPDHTELVTTRFGAMTLAESGLMGPDERGAALASLCTAIEALHRAGWAHGALQASHVLVGHHGRVRFCSLADAVPISLPIDARSDGGVATVHRSGSAASVTTEAVAEDRAALVGLVTEVLAEPATFDSRRIRHRWDRSARRATHGLARRGGSPSGEEVLEVLRAAGLPGTQAADTPRRTGSRRRPIDGVRVRSVAIAAGAVALAAGGLGWALNPDDPEPAGVAEVAEPSEPPGTAEPSTAVPACSSDAGPLTDGEIPADVDGDGRCDTVALDGHVLTVDDRRYEVGLPGDLPQLGDWDCDGRATVALLRPSTGEVFEFDGWATDTAAKDATLLGTFPGSIALEAPARACGPAQVRLGDGAVREAE